jgi:hypothetical protein
MFMIAVSVVLFVYWFRYTCLLILSARPARDYSAQVAIANELRYPEVQRALASATESGYLENLQNDLERDYRLLTYLLQHGARFQAVSQILEQRMLMLYFHIMKLRCALSRIAPVLERRKALEEMASVLGYFANQMGERALA